MYNPRPGQNVTTRSWALQMKARSKGLRRIHAAKGHTRPAERLPMPGRKVALGPCRSQCNMWGFPRNRGYPFFGGSFEKDYSTLGYIRGTPIFRDPHVSRGTCRNLPLCSQLWSPVIPNLINPRSTPMHPSTNPRITTRTVQ